MEISGKYINYKFLGFVETVLCTRFYDVTVNTRMEILIPTLSYLVSAVHLDVKSRKKMA